MSSVCARTFGVLCFVGSVVTTIFQPSKAVQVAAKVPGWCIVIVADNKTPANYLEASGLEGMPSVIFLTPSMQRDMEAAGDAFVKATPWNHFARKNIGFLYAVRHGAKFIYDFDDDNELIPAGKEGSLNPLPDGNEEILTDVRQLVHPGGAPQILNPYPLMEASEPVTWPRGFPLELIKDNATHGRVAAWALWQPGASVRVQATTVTNSVQLYLNGVERAVFLHFII